MKSRGTVFTLLDQIRKRPEMYLPQQSLEALEVLPGGYHAALHMPGIVEPVPAMNRHFRSWLAYRTGWSCAAGFARLIAEHYPRSESPLNQFFLWADEYRVLKPTPLYHVPLQAHHQPTGNRVTYGHGGRMERPNRVEMMHYQPEPLHVLTVLYPDRIVQHGIVLDGAGNDVSSPDTAKRCMADEFQVAVDEWGAYAEGVVS